MASSDSDVRHQLDVPRVLRDIGYEHRLAMERGVADEPFSQAERGYPHFFSILDRQLHLELPALFVEQQDPERAVVDQPLRQLRDPREQLVELEDRRDLPADLGERLECVGVAAASLEQPRVDQRNRDVRTELPDDLDVTGGELVGVLAENVQRANRPGLVQQGDDDFGVHARHDLDVSRIGAQVVDEQRLLAGDCGADEPGAELQAERLVNLRVADRVGGAQFPSALVEEVDGKRLEGDEPADEPRNLLQQLVQVENARHLAPEVEQRREKIVLGRRRAGVCARFDWCAVRWNALAHVDGRPFRW